MSYIRTRLIAIDIIPGDTDPFVTMTLEKVLTSGMGSSGEVLQTIGSFGKIVKRTSEAVDLPISDIANDGAVSSLELFSLIADHMHIWVAEKYGGTPCMGGVTAD